MKKHITELELSAAWNFKRDLNSRVKAGTKARIIGFKLEPSPFGFGKTLIPMVLVCDVWKNPKWINAGWFV